MCLVLLTCRPRLARGANPLLFSTGSVLLYACQAQGVANGGEEGAGCIPLVLSEPSVAVA